MGASKWIAGVALALAMAPVAHATPSFPPGATGDWMGTLGAMGAPRRIFIHIHQRLSGEYVGAMDSLDRDYASVPITPIAAADDTLAFAVDGAEFRGDWDAVHGQWRGTWTEAGASWPLNLTQNVDSRTSQRLTRH